MKGSILAKDTVPSFGEALRRKRQLFIEEFSSIIDGEIILHTDYTFNSPSTAADFSVGRRCNGWSEWKDIDGKTLDEVHRKQLE